MPKDPACSGIFSAFVNAYALRSALADFNLFVPGPVIELDDDEGKGLGTLALTGAMPDVMEVQGSDDEADTNHCAAASSAATASSACGSVPRQQCQSSQALVVKERPVNQVACVDARSNRFQVLTAMDHLSLVRHAAKLEDLLVSRDSRISKQRNALKRSQRLARKSQQLVLQSKEQVARQKLEAFTISKLGRQKEGRGGRLSMSSMFSIGIRRCCTNISALDFGVVAMLDVSSQTVMRCEHKTASSILYSMASFVSEGLDDAFREYKLYKACLDSGDASAANNHWSLMCIGVRTDATNSSIWRRKKLQVLESTVMYLTDDGIAHPARRRCVPIGDNKDKFTLVCLPFLPRSPNFCIAVDVDLLLFASL